RSTPYNPNSLNQDWSSGYDFKRIGENTDFVTLMTYDDPLSIGPVASVPFIERTLTYMLTQIPAEKISLGIPLYCWRWDPLINRRTGSLSHENALSEFNRSSIQGVEMYIEQLGSHVYIYEKDRGIALSWCDNIQSIEKKL